MSDNGKQYENNEQAIAGGRAIVDRTLAALKRAGLIEGFAYVLKEVSEDETADVYQAHGCCAFHMVDGLDPEILSVSDNADVQELLSRKMLGGLLKAMGGSQDAYQGLVDLGFREAFPEPSQERTESQPESSQFGSLDDEQTTALYRRMDRRDNYEGEGPGYFDTMDEGYL